MRHASHVSNPRRIARNQNRLNIKTKIPEVMTEIVAKTTQVAEHVALAAAGDPLAYVSLFSDGVEAAKIVGECLKVKETDLDKKSKLTFVLSPSFGTLTKDDVRKMDEFLMASCAFAKKQLAKNLETKGLALTWSDGNFIVFFFNFFFFLLFIIVSFCFSSSFNLLTFLFFPSARDYEPMPSPQDQGGARRQSRHPPTDISRLV